MAAKKAPPQRDTSPRDMNPSPSPNLQIVGNDTSSSKGLSPAFQGDPPGRDRPRSPRQHKSPPVTVMTWGDREFGPTPNFDEVDEGVHGHSMARGNASISGSWKRVLGKGEFSFEKPPQPEALGAGLPSTPDQMRSSPSLVKGGALRRAPAVASTTQLPTLTDTSRNATASKQRAAEKLMSNSMPDLGAHFDSRPAAVRTPPLAGSSLGHDPASPSKKIRARKIGSAMTPVSSGKHGAGDGAAGPVAPFEVPLLYVGNPPTPPSAMGPDSSLRLSHSHTTGASHTVPIDRSHFMMAATALELGSHVQRHAAFDEAVLNLESPLIVQHAGGIPEKPQGINVGGIRKLLS